MKNSNEAENFSDYFSAELLEFRKNNACLSGLKDEILFTLLCVDYLYCDGEEITSSFLDFHTDGPNDGGIDYIFRDPDEDRVVLVQSKYEEELKSSENIGSIFKEMAGTYNDLKRNHIESYRPALVEAFSDTEAADASSVGLVLVTRYGLKEREREKINRKLSESSDLKKFDCTVYDALSLKNLFEQVRSPQKCVKEGKIEFYNAMKSVQWRDNESNELRAAILLLSANSLKSLYGSYGNRGLFDQNLRYHISDKSTVDSGIRKSIENDAHSFWLKNNGIIIVCSGFEISGNCVRLYDFSIVNGAQTMTQLGRHKKIDRDYDFPVVCKIVTYSNEETLAEISQASNTQKPIKSRDLFSNRPEQQGLQRKMRERCPMINVEIKRGEPKASRTKYPEKWQRTINTEVGQLILATLLQKPGVAYNGASKIFDNKTLYNDIFCRDHDYDTLEDLLRLANIYELFKERKKDAIQSSETTAAVARVGKCTALPLGRAFPSARSDYPPVSLLHYLVR